MKRLFMAFFAVAALAGCSKSEVNNSAEDERIPFTIYVSASSDNGTKTSFDESTYAVTWVKGDALAVKIDNSETPYKFVNKTGEDNAFTCDDFTPGEGEHTYEILYPYDKDFKFTMSGGIKTPMYGTATATGSDAPEVEMKQLSAIIKVTVKNESESGTAALSSLRIERVDGGVLGGKHQIVEGKAEPVSGSTVSYTEVNSQSKKIAAGASVDMYLQCAPFTAEAGATLNIKYTVNGKEYSAEKTFTKNVEFVAGKVNRTTVSFKTKAIYIDFGANVTTGWNSVTSVSAKDVNLLYLDGTDSGIDFSIGDGWALYDPVKSEPKEYITYNNIQYPLTAWSDAFMFEKTSDSREMTFSGLDSEKSYKFTIMAFRWNGTPTARATNYWLVGASTTDTKKVYQGVKDKMPTNITNHFAVFENVVPDADGKVVLNITADLIGTVQQAHVSAIVIEIAE